MAGLTSQQQKARARDLWDRLYRRRQSVREIAADLNQTPQSIYAFMSRRCWRMPPSDEALAWRRPERP